MKIKVLLVVFIFSLSSFLSIRDIENNKLWNFITDSDSKYNSEFYINISETSANIDGFFKTLLNEANENNLVLRITRGNRETGKFDSFYYQPLGQNVLSFPVISQQNFIDFSSLEKDQFYSSNRVEESSGYLFNYYHSEVSDYQIHNFKKVIDNEVRISGTINVDGSKHDVEELKENINAIFGEETFKEVEKVFSDEETLSFVDNRLLIVTVILMVLVFLVGVSKKAKEISIRQINGQNIIAIIFKLFTPMLILSVLSYLLFNAFFYYLFVGTYNQYTWGLVVSIIINLGMLLTILIGAILFILIVMQFIPKQSFVKNKSINNYLHTFSYLIKVILIVVLVPSIYSILVSTFSDAENLNSLNLRKEKLSHLTEMTTVFPNSDITTQESLDAIIAIGKEELSANRDSYSFGSLRFENDGTLHEVIAVEYAYYQIALSEKLPQINQNNVTILKQNEAMQLPYFLLEHEYSDIKGVKDDFSVPYAGGSAEDIKNPILVIYPNADDLKKDFPHYNVRNIQSNPLDAIRVRQEMNEKFEPHLFFGAYEEINRQEIKMVKSSLEANVITLTQSILTISFVMILGNVTLIASKESEYALMLILGYSGFKRKSNLIFNHLFIFILSFCYLAISKVSLTHSFLFSVSIIIFDYLLVSYVLKREQSKVMRVLKKG